MNLPNYLREESFPLGPFLQLFKSVNLANVSVFGGYYLSNFIAFIKVLSHFNFVRPIQSNKP